MGREYGYKYVNPNGSLGITFAYEKIEDAVKVAINSNVRTIFSGYAPYDIAIFSRTSNSVRDEYGETLRTVTIRREHIIPASEMRNYDWTEEIRSRISWMWATRENVAEARTWIDNLYKNGYISDEQEDLLQNILEDKMKSMTIVKGRFIEGEMVAVVCFGEIYERKVHYSKSAGDLYITIDRKKYFYCEFTHKS